MSTQNELGKTEQGKYIKKIGIFFVLLLLFFSAQQVASAPDIDLYENYEKGVWDCSNIAALVFTIKQWEGVNVTIEIGCENETTKVCHAWVEEDGEIIVGGEDTWLSESLIYRRESFKSIDEIEKKYPGQWNITK